MNSANFVGDQSAEKIPYPWQFASHRAGGADSKSLLRSIEAGIKQNWTHGKWNMSMLIAAWHEPDAVDFYRRLEAEAFTPDHLVRVLPNCKAIYLMVPKVASTRIRKTLGLIDGRRSRRLKPSQWGKIREAQGPRSVSVRSLYRLATSPTTFRFSFVRNPYARLLAFWASRYQNEPLAPGSWPIDNYLAQREPIDPTLATGFDKKLSFEQFVTFATSGHELRSNQHLIPQDDLLTVPGIALDFVGRIESFAADFGVVLDRLGANEEIRREARVPLNESCHGHWADYYTPSLADRVYRIYERDFDRFRYPRLLPIR